MLAARNVVTARFVLAPRSRCFLGPRVVRQHAANAAKARARLDVGCQYFLDPMPKRQVGETDDAREPLHAEALEPPRFIDRREG